jgi:hypothetical protein
VRRQKSDFPTPAIKFKIVSPSVPHPRKFPERPVCAGDQLSLFVEGAYVEEVRLGDNAPLQIGSIPALIER